MKTYDIVYLTGTPAFYKLNLFNRIAERKKIYVIFLTDFRLIRNSDFYRGERNFDWVSLSEKPLLFKIILIYKLLKKTDYNSLLISGWDYIYCWYAAFISPKVKNAVVIESSVYDSFTKGYKGFLKRIFLRRITRAYVSGKAQKALLQNLRFRGIITITKGVGIFNLSGKQTYTEKKHITNFIFVGRLSPEKNLKYLVQTFNSLPDFTLNIVGFGPMEEELKKLSSGNIKFHGAINNSDLPAYYRENDALILPSLYEPWGLVVEEALNNGLPVIISNRVGCADEIIKQDVNGIIFSLSEINSLRDAIIKISDIKYYNKLKKNVIEMDFTRIANEQVESYL